MNKSESRLPGELETLNARELAEELLKLMKEFEEFLLTKSGDINLIEEGWETKAKLIYKYANKVWTYRKLDIFRGVSWWAGNIEKSYMENYNVEIGLNMLQGERGFIHAIAQNISKTGLKA